MSSRTQLVPQAAPRVCPHRPACPPATAHDRQAAHVIASHPEQGWSLLCNGLVIFADTGDMLPGGVAHGPHRPKTPDRRAWRRAARARGRGRRTWPRLTGRRG